MDPGRPARYERGAPISSGFWHPTHQVTRFAGAAVMRDKGTVVGRLVELDGHHFAAVIRHPVTQQELVVGVWPSYRDACSGLWRVHSLPRNRKLDYLDRSSVS
jgi:hypothetical protein